MNTPITLNPEEHAELSRRVRSATISQRDGRRARVILLAAEGRTRVEIARLTGFLLPVITCWCQRFLAQRLEGLLDKSGRGRKPFLPFEAVRRVLEQVTQPCALGHRSYSHSVARLCASRYGHAVYGAGLSSGPFDQQH